jgi:hypothetical protein
MNDVLDFVANQWSDIAIIALAIGIVGFRSLNERRFQRKDQRVAPCVETGLDQKTHDVA